MNKILSALLATHFVLAASACAQGGHSENTTAKAVSKSTDHGSHIQFIAHASFRFQADDGSSVVIDPFNSRIWLGYQYPKNIKADAVLITHPHFDHDAHYYFPSSTPVFKKAGVHKIGSITVRGIQSEHAFADSIRKRGFLANNILWVIEYDGKRIVHFGDNREINDAEVEVIRNLGAIDFAIGAERQGVTKIDAKHIIPMHYRLPEIAPDGGQGMQTLAEIIDGKSSVNSLTGNVLKFDDIGNDSKWIAFKPMEGLAVWTQAQRDAAKELDAANKLLGGEPVNLTKAAEHAEKAIAKDPTWMRAYLTLAGVHEKQSTPPKETVALLEIGLEKANDLDLSEKYRATYRLAKLALKSGDTARTQRYYKALLDMPKSYGVAQYEEAETYFAQSQ